MEKIMKHVSTLSNTTQSSGHGIPDTLTADKLKADFIQNFFERSEKSVSTPMRHHMTTEVYSTVVG